MTNPPNTIDAVGKSLTDSRLTEAVAMLEADGYAYLSGADDGFDHIAEAGRFGRHVPQYRGDLVREVKPDPALADAAISANNMKALSPHTESFEFTGLPPRYVALWCVRPAEGPGGETTLADGHRFLDEFGSEDQALMRTRMYEWRSPASLGRQGITMSATHPILQDDPGGLVMRYSSREMYQAEEHEDGLLRRYVDGGVAFFDATRLEVRIARNSMLIWDNWRMMHSRNAFTDPGRYLRRVLLQEPEVRR